MFCKTKLPLLATLTVSIFTMAFIASLFIPSDAFAHTATLSTSGTINIDVSPAGVGGSDGGSIGVDNLIVNSTCPLGYTVSISGPTDNTLYKNGDNTNTGTNQKILASPGTTQSPVSILDGNLGTWGYTLDPDVDPSYTIFKGLTNSTTAIFGKEAASGDGSGDPTTGIDTIPVYYGVSATSSLEPGLYQLAESSQGANDNVITYYLTTSAACDSFVIKYNDNGANSTTTMGGQTISTSATTVDLWPSNFQRSGYGFAGWNTRADGTGTNFGPMETVNGTALQTLMSQAVVENGQQVIKLYAKWVQSAGNIQSWAGCSSLASGAVTALTDTRDNNTYAIAKLADGKCWMIENLRLADQTSSGAAIELSDINTNNPSLPITNIYDATNPTTSNSLSPSQDPTQTAWCSSGTASCYDQSMLFTGNTTNTVANMTTPSIASDSNTGIYSYGNYYNWYSVTAGNGKYSTSSGDAAGSICPAGWHLPTGNTSGEFYTLNTQANSGSTTSDSGLRAFPNNFLYSGHLSKSSVNYRGSNGYYWSSTTRNSGFAYALLFYSTYVSPGTYSLTIYKYSGFTARCVASDSYAIHFNANGGAGTMNDQIAFVNQNTTLTTNAYTKSGYGFAGWNTAADGSGTAYANGASVTNLSTTNGVATLYAQWGCEANKVCYSDNGANSTTTMGKQSIGASATSITLWPSNYKRSNYGFAGWNTKADGTGTNYGPMETITITAGQYSTVGLQLYAKWIQSAGNLQNWSGCSSLASGAVTALKDTRDNNVYAVAKLADGKCWMIENLRLDNTNSDNATGALAQGYNSSFVGLANAESPWGNNSTAANSLYSIDGSNNTTAITGNSQVQRFPRYNNNNTNNTVANMTTSSSANIYSYGNYYTWSAVVADTSYYTTEQSITTTSICPKGWRLPQGGDKTRIESNDDNDYWNLVVDGLNNGTNPTNYNSSANPYYTGAAEAGPVDNALRAFPNNFLYSGFVNASTYSSISSRGSFSYYWSSTAINQLGADYLYFYSTHVLPGTNSTNKYLGFTVRCIAGS